MGQVLFWSIDHMDYNGLLLIAQYFAVCQSPEALSLHFEKIPDINVRLLVITWSALAF